MKKLFCLIVAAALLPFCLSAQSLVGTWEVVGSNDAGAAVATLTFNEDGTFVREYTQDALAPSGKLTKGVYHEEGDWKLILGGKKVMMKVRPSSINVDAGQGVAGGVGKVVAAFSKVEALTTVYTPRILSLTDTELVMRETCDDSDGDTQVMKVKYIRK